MVRAEKKGLNGAWISLSYRTLGTTFPPSEYGCLVLGFALGIGKKTVMYQVYTICEMFEY